jgi:hypothetical protein
MWEKYRNVSDINTLTIKNRFLNNNGLKNNSELSEN